MAKDAMKKVDPREEAVASLMKAAANELLAAKIMAGEGTRMAPSVVFHSQRAAESALCAFLAAQGVASKAKNLAAILEQCRRYSQALAEVELARLEAAATAPAEARRIVAVVTEALPPEIRKAMGG